MYIYIIKLENNFNGCYKVKVAKNEITKETPKLYYCGNRQYKKDGLDKVRTASNCISRYNTSREIVTIREDMIWMYKTKLVRYQVAQYDKFIKNFIKEFGSLTDLEISLYDKTDILSEEV